jgi:transcriptional regulator with XRE-family HTH domain
VASKSDKEKKDQARTEKLERKREVAGGVAAEIGERIATRRVAKNLTQEELASRADLDTSGLSSIELGESCPRADTLVRIAGGLGCPSAELTEGLTWTPDLERPGHGKLTVEPDQGSDEN